MRLAETRGHSKDEGADRVIGNLFLDEYLTEYFPNCPAVIRNEVKTNYLQGGDFDKNFTGANAETILTIYSDLLYTSPALAMLDTHCSGRQTEGRKGSTYMYRFDLETQKSQSSNPAW